MSQSLQTGTTTVNGSVTTSIASFSPGLPDYYKIIRGNSPTIGTENTSNFGFIPNNTTVPLTTINVRDSEQKGRIVFPAAVTIGAGTIQAVLKHTHTSGLTWTVQFHKIATDGTKTQIGGDITIAGNTQDAVYMGPLNNNAVSFLAGEGLQFEIINNYASTGTTMGDGTGMIFMRL